MPGVTPIGETAGRVLTPMALRTKICPSPGFGIYRVSEKSILTTSDRNKRNILLFHEGSFHSFVKQRILLLLSIYRNFSYFTLDAYS